MRKTSFGVLPGLLTFALTASATGQFSPRRQGDAGWWERAREGRSAHYVIRTDLPAEDLRPYARHLDLVYEAMSRRLASLPARAPQELRVLVFRHRSDYVGTLNERWAIDAEGTGGMFFVDEGSGWLALYTADLPARRIRHVIQHEGFHQFAYSRFGTDLPIWLNEGLAELFGRAVLARNTLVMGQARPHVVEQLQSFVLSGSYVPVGNMLAMSPERWRSRAAQDDGAGLYLQAWSMVHFLVEGDGGRYRARFERYLRLLNDALPPDHAFRRAFGENVGGFEQRWLAHVEQLEPGPFVTALDRIEFLAEGARELARRGVVPETLDELKKELRAIGFSHDVGYADVRVTLDAMNDEVFTIPGVDDESGPTFELERPRRWGRSAREREWEEELPTPWTIVTNGLRPRELRVQWSRDRETGALRYGIEAR
jgi:hypothetical protein